MRTLGAAFLLLVPLASCHPEPYRIDFPLLLGDRSVLLAVAEETAARRRISYTVVDLETEASDRPIPAVVDYTPHDRVTFLALTSSLAPSAVRLAVGSMEDSESDQPHHRLTELAEMFSRRLEAAVVNDELVPWHTSAKVPTVFQPARVPRVRDCIRTEVELQLPLPPKADVTFVLTQRDGSHVIGTEAGGVHRDDDGSARIFLLDTALDTYEVRDAAEQVFVVRVATALADGRLFFLSDGDRVFLADDVRAVGGGRAELSGLREIPTSHDPSLPTVCENDTSFPDQAWIARWHFPRALELNWRNEDDFEVYLIDRAGAVLRFDGRSRTCLGRLRMPTENSLGRMARDTDGSIVAVSPADPRILRALGIRASFETVLDTTDEGLSAANLTERLGLVLGTSKGRVLMRGPGGAWLPKEGALIAPVYEALELRNPENDETGLFVTGEDGVAGQTWRRDRDLCVEPGSLTSQAARFIRPLADGRLLLFGERPFGARTQGIRGFVVRPRFDRAE
jgi:hypothetical protein